MILKEFRKYLWDSNVDNMDMQTYKYLIISRVLEHGSLVDVQKILSLYSSKDIIKTIEDSSEISKKTAYFWKYYYNIQTPIKCLTPQLRKKQENLWPY